MLLCCSKYSIRVRSTTDWRVIYSVEYSTVRSISSESYWLVVNKTVPGTLCTIIENISIMLGSAGKHLPHPDVQLYIHSWQRMVSLPSDDNWWCLHIRSSHAQEIYCLSSNWFVLFPSTWRAPIPGEVGANQFYTWLNLHSGSSFGRCKRYHSGMSFSVCIITQNQSFPLTMHMATESSPLHCMISCCIEIVRGNSSGGGQKILGDPPWERAFWMVYTKTSKLYVDWQQ